MPRPSILFRTLPVALVPLLLPALVLAAGRVIVVPVVVAGGTEPSAALIGALAEGLKQNPQWSVTHGGALNTASEAKPAFTDDELTVLQTRLDEALSKLGEGTEDAATEAANALLTVRAELIEGRKKAPLPDRGEALAHRANAQAVAAHLKAGQPDAAKAAADELSLLFPGRKAEGFELAAEARELIEATKPDLGVKVTLKTRPEGCEVSVGGVLLGKAPVQLAALPGTSYHAEARCAPAAGSTPGAVPGPSLVAVTKRFAVATGQTSREELLDLDFERSMRSEGAARLRFASPGDRKQLEDAQARRLAERHDAEVVVLVSVGELSGADWLNGRLYLRSGYLNRQGMVRLETARANALGRYLATGKDVPGVLKPEEAGQLVAAAQSAPKETDGVSPWYTDVPGWCFTGVGLIGAGFGFYAKSVADKKQEEADAIRMDFDRQQKMYRDAQGMKFWSGVGIFGGLLTGVTGIVLLAIPEYNSSSELFVLAPTRGGATLTLGGRF